MRINNRDAREIILVVLSLFYLANSFKIGFWIIGDMHSGGPLLGLLLFPLILAAMVLVLFINEPKRRLYSSVVIGVYVVAAVVLGILFRGS